MKFSENSGQAAEYLRQAVPLMVKHSIPPNPLNYALWYTYVSKRVPALNKELDQTLNVYGTCPGIVGERMFREHMIKNETDGAEKVQSGLVALMNDLSKHSHETSENTQAYSEVLKDSLSALKDDNASSLPLEKIIQTLATHTEQISATTQRFQSRIDEAQSEIAELRAELQKARQDASIDVLTGLYNRRTFDTEATAVIDANGSAKATLILVDIDHFKRFNDTYGHLMGDKVLSYVGALLKEGCPAPMLPVRYGGEEFAVLVSGESLKHAAQVAEGLRAKIQAIRIKQKNSGEVISSITASFGVAELQPGDTLASLIERADNALYKAKSSGRNQVQIAN